MLRLNRCIDGVFPVHTKNWSLADVTMTSTKCANSLSADSTTFVSQQSQKFNLQLPCGFRLKIL